VNGTKIHNYAIENIEELLEEVEDVAAD